MPYLVKDPMKIKEQAGLRGEEEVYFRLANYSKSRALIYGMVTRFAYRVGKGSREVDLIYINKKGVFVIEIKNWGGVIKGDISDPKWLQMKRSETVELKNPVQQIKKHVNDVREFLGNNYPVFPLVVFIKNNVKNIKVPIVINFDELVPYLDHLNVSQHLKDSEIKKIEELLELIKSRDSVSINEHKRNAINAKHLHKKPQDDVLKLVRSYRK